MAYTGHDFIVDYDPDKDTEEDVSERILIHIFYYKLKQNKPCNIFISGGSGSGKTLASIRIQQLICKAEGINALDFLDVMNIFTTTEYSEKMKKLLYDSNYKKVKVVAIQEGRILVNSKEWNQWINLTVAQVTALQRALKRMVFIVVSQNLRDITTDMRFQMHYFCEVKRSNNRESHLSIRKITEDVHDLMKPKIQATKIHGLLVYPNGSQRWLTIPHFRLKKPAREYCERIEHLDHEAKAQIINNQLDKLLKQMNRGLVDETAKVQKIIDFYKSQPELINTVIRRYRNKYVGLPDLKKVHDFTKSEEELFLRRVNNEWATLIGGHDDTTTTEPEQPG